MTTIGAGAVTYIVGPVTGAALGASSDVMALSIATGLVKAIIVMVGTPWSREFLGLTTRARRWCSAAWRAPSAASRPAWRRPTEAGALRRADRDLPHRPRLPDRAVAVLPDVRAMVGEADWRKSMTGRPAAS